jgi:WD40 repeat protein
VTLLAEPPGTARTVALSPDGRLLAAAGDGEARLWEAETGKELLTLPVQGWSRSLSFSPDGGRLAVADGTGVKIWELETGQLALTLKGVPGEGGLEVAFSPDGRRLASADGQTGRVTVWDAPPGQ